MSALMEPVLEAPPRTPAAEAKETTTLLVVDDSRMVRGVVAKLVQDALECEVLTASHGKEALEICRTRVPTAVVTDIHMPEMDGLALVVALKETLPQVPVILMTGEGSEEMALQALRSGATNYVTKKNIKAELIETLEIVLQAARVDRRKQRLLNSLSRRESQFDIDNDATLVSHLVMLLQEELTAMGLCSPSERIRLGVALEEAMLNALYHGNLGVSSELRRESEDEFYALINRRKQETPYRDRRVHVTSRFTRSEAVFVIRDEGSGFDVSKLPDPSDPANLEKPSGRGVLLIRTFMDEVRFNDLGNEITMVKRSRPR